MQGRNRSVQHVENSVEMLGLLDGGNVRWFFDDADQALVTGGACAIDTRVNVGDVVADRAEAQAGLYVTDGSRQRFGVFITGSQNVKGKALRAFRSYARELFELINEARHRFGKFRHWFLRNGCRFRTGNSIVAGAEEINPPQPLRSEEHTSELQ